MRASTRSATGSSASGKAAVRAAVGAMARGYVAGSAAGIAAPEAARRRGRSLRSVAEFLSDEWIAALATRPRTRTGRRRRRRRGLVVEPVVRGVPGRGEVRYRVAFDATVVRGRRPVADATTPADVRLETDYATAVALARGEMNAQAALADGRLRVSGDVARLAAHAAALARSTTCSPSVRATTTYPRPPDRS